MATNSSRSASANLSFNPHVAALPPYNAGLNIAVARSISGRDDVARLGSNENPYGCSSAVLRALTSPAFDPSRYADPACQELRAAISQRLGAAPERIVIGNGSEEMIAAPRRRLTSTPPPRLRPSQPLGMKHGCGNRSHAFARNANASARLSPA